MTRYARNIWYVAAWQEYVEADKPLSVKLLDQPIVLWRAGDEIVAHEDRCPHRFAPMSLGRCEGASLRCMYHGFRFDADGNCVEIPGQDIIPPAARLRKYPSAVRNELVWIWMGDPAKADPALIPDTIDPYAGEFAMSVSHLDFEAEGFLLTQNLLDFSHVSFVHQASFELGDAHAKKLPKWDSAEYGMDYTHWDENIPPPPFAQSDEESVDFLLCYDFRLPSVMTLRSGIFPAGSAGKYDQGRPDWSEALALSASVQAVTPVSDGKCRYFFSVGALRALGGEEAKQQQFDIAWQAFHEDKLIIEGQQKVIDQTGEGLPVLSAHDKANTQIERMIGRMIKMEEQAGL